MFDIAAISLRDRREIDITINNNKKYFNENFMKYIVERDI